MKKTICALIMLIMLFVQTAEAATYTVTAVKQTKPSKYDFESEWEVTKEFYYNDVYIGVITYGYDTDWIKEDYTWVNADLYTHYASVDNDKGLYKSGDKLKTVWAKIEITHKGEKSQVYRAYLKKFDYDCIWTDFDLE